MTGRIIRFVLAAILVIVAVWAIAVIAAVGVVVVWVFTKLIRSVLGGPQRQRGTS